jgi:hypothetical protein
MDHDAASWDVPLTAAEVNLLVWHLQHNGFERVTRLWWVILAQGKLVGDLR